MGYIYKITNKLNGKAYIGKTQRTVWTRWKEHLKSREKLDLPIYRALNKYGPDSFTVEELERCDDELLDEREIYWIKYYGTYGEKGYNATGGGEGGIKDYHEFIDELIERYQAGERLDRLCKEFHCDYTSIRPKLIDRGVEINTYAGPKKLSKMIAAIDPETMTIAGIYESISAAARAISTGQSPKSITNHICKQRDYGNVCHGYLWKTEETLPNLQELKVGDSVEN